jgi:ribosome maturation factor RimP
MRKEIANLWNLIEPAAKGLGFELVELQWGREEGGFALCVFIDRPFGPDDAPRLPGAKAPDELFRPPGVTHEDCEQVSRDLSAALDVADLIPQAYRLEVSSPGIERPLRKQEDFQRFAGRKAKIRTATAVDGRRNFSGILRGAQAGVVEIEGDGQSHQVPLDEIVKANLVPDWAAEFRRAAGGEGPEPAKTMNDKSRRAPRAGGRGGRSNSGSTRSAS